MGETPKPRILASKCLGFDACRYNGQSINDDFVGKLRGYADFLTVCPEVGIGLGVPRFPIRIVSPKGADRLVQPATGLDLTERMNDFCDSFLRDLADIDGCILKGSSPSCGIKGVKLYAKAEVSPVVGTGAGLFGRKVVSKFNGLAISDELRLSNFKIREGFLTRVFAHARLRQVRDSGKISKLVDFHAAHKFMLMAWSPRWLSKLGNIVANREGRDFRKIIEAYERSYNAALSETPQKPRLANTFTHIFGYFSDDLSKQEKKFFLETMELFAEDRIPSSSVVRLLGSWAVRFDNKYLLQQSLFSPYPPGLMELSDGGKPINL